MTTIASGWRSTITATAWHSSSAGTASAGLRVPAAWHERIGWSTVVVRRRCIRIHFVTAATVAAWFAHILRGDTRWGWWWIGGGWIAATIEQLRWRLLLLLLRRLGTWGRHLMRTMWLQADRRHATRWLVIIHWHGRPSRLLSRRASLTAAGRGGAAAAGTLCWRSWARLMTGGRTTAVARLLGLVICGKARRKLSIQKVKNSFTGTYLHVPRVAGRLDNLATCDWTMRR